MWAEKVERLWSIDCSSPMSAKRELNTGSLVPSFAGSGNPVWFKSAKRANVFKLTVFPPVFGPVIIKTLFSGRNFISIGTAFSPKSGCRAAFKAGGINESSSWWHKSA